ncbi:MAG: tRNA 2-thiocytidine biosynthesis TtcA family protein [Sphaerochaetaceae bacterium]|jgi:tRNA 2-thiocytidine biosynthesis protein TtcA|nr:tRNA 2-thiocytidine biosynthesis TtcA family protein [Sphaerochaetaceae bacterium]
MDVRDLLEDMPPWVMRFIKQTGKTINDYSMIRADEKILIGVSGGKDSLALAFALSARRRWLPIHYSLKAVMINWVEHPIPVEYRAKLQDYFDALDIDFSIVDEEQYSEGFKGEFNCYLCSRNRRRILFQIADSQGYDTIALGHHQNDMTETALMNIFFRGDFATMKPVQEFFDGKLFIIRPMIEVKEAVTIRFAHDFDIPVVKPVCPYDQTNIRARLKPIVKELVSLDRHAQEHLFSAFSFDCKKEKA